MLGSVDFFFNNKFSSRHYLIHKLHSVHGALLPHIIDLVLLFSLRDLETLDDVRLYNYFFFFKFFLGVRPIFSGYKSKFHLGKTTYSIKVQLMGFVYAFDILYFFSNDVFALLDKSYLSTMYYRKRKSHQILYILKDMNLFIEKKTNIGLFNLKNSLNISFVFASNNKAGASLLLQTFKIYL